MRAVDFVAETTMKYVEEMPKSQRKKYGQFFTSKETAAFMAGLLEIPRDKQTISVLDPGAGSGILAAAVVDRLETVSNIEMVCLTCYENNDGVIELLRSNLELIKKDSICLDYVIVHELSHLIHGNHSKDFWRLVEENFPKYKEVRKMMKEE